MTFKTVVRKYDDNMENEDMPMITGLLTNLGFYILMLAGFVSQLFVKQNVETEKNRDGYVPLYNKFELFYFGYVYRRIRDCFNRPVVGVPGAEITIKDRKSDDFGWTFEFSGTETKCLNLASYNYLGFASNTGTCAENTIKTIQEFGLVSCSPRSELGTTTLLVELEQLTAQLLGVEDSIVFGMGFASNALNLPALLSPGCLVISDEKNHASIILGLRLSGATIRVFKHNNMRSLETKLEEAVCKGQPNGAPWKKILIIVEGIYSMEGSIVKLPEVVALKKKYKAYLYLDEAHSVGAMGKHGRGVLDYFGIDPKDVDILMGTFTKSFASSGGYIAGSKKLIDFLRQNSHAHCYASSMSPPVAQQILTAMKIVMGLDGTDEGQRRIIQLARNTKYFRRKFSQLGVIVYGHEDSMVVPMIVYFYSKLTAVVRRLTERNIAVVGVGFPATRLFYGRVRFCLSAAHTKEQLDYAIQVIAEESETLGLKYSRRPRNYDPIEY
ncbi:serine palmitoyltransferase 2-like [Bradysia coprophila]|uniref:serine palmitoyltransferase 2-like n=1 Tax=Bradysia coprophila TaxID=38358 RepID=UPI00187DD6B1|nr:serine palmitoyltransferase 2-like [Bradysia coprophila]XP_037048796.1 serine palmitoyltransferase 2-like [Bradysia coprophila]